MNFAPMPIPAMALLQQHDARRDTVIEPAVQRRAAIKARGIRNWKLSELGAQSGRKNPPACLSVSDRHFYPSTLTIFMKLGHKDPTAI